ncbi:MAG: hypothetical protein IIB13_04975 [Chloroflexi bacterium]|nr:hypothetical protein [Chloroflexota bacterium]
MLKNFLLEKVESKLTGVSKRGGAPLLIFPPSPYQGEGGLRGIGFLKTKLNGIIALHPDRLNAGRKGNILDI